MFLKKAIHAWLSAPLILLANVVLMSVPLSVRAAPTLGIYQNTSVTTAGSALVQPSAAPVNAVRTTAAAPPNFKGTLAVNPVTGAVRITNAYPAGTYQIVVSAFDAANARVASSFTLTVQPSAESCPEMFFSPAASSPVFVGSVLRSVVVGDFNGDGRQDLSSTVAGGNGLSVLLGSGAGSFAPSTYFPTGDDPVMVTTGDFNGDGHQDLANANEQTNILSVLLGDGAGNFGAPVNYGTSPDPRSIAVGDFNADGRADLVTGNFGGNNVSILLGNGDGTFQAATAVAVGLAPISVAVGDFNADGRQDIATANLNSGNVSVLLRNAANNGFSAAANFAAGSAPVSLATGDFNADGRADIAAVNNQSNNVSVLLRNAANNGFVAASNFAVGVFPMFLASADFNGDGRADLVAANRNNNNVSVLIRNAANNGFDAAVNFAVGDMPWAVAVGDFNADNRQDLAVANFFSANISILLRQCFAPTAAAVEVGGRVATAEGAGIANARVSMTDSAGETREALTNSFGFYRFSEVPAGETYVFTVKHKRYSFDAPTQVHYIDDARDNLDFTALSDASLFENTRIFGRPQF